MRLLVVDDDPALREALALLLDLNGFEVQTAGDGREAMRALANEAPDALVLDVLMPQLDGPGRARRIRAMGDRTPVLMLTARTEVSDRVAGLEAGADDYLAKPFAREELIARLRARPRPAGTGGPGRGGCPPGGGRAGGARAGGGTSSRCCATRTGSSPRSPMRPA